MSTRRQFLRTTSATLAASALGAGAARAAAGATSETLVAQLYSSLDETQRGAICLPFDHELRQKVDNNWHITKQKLGSGFFTPDQQELTKEIFLKLHSDEYADTVFKQVEHDSGQAGFGDSSIALFGEPGSGKFEFVLTGRHCTRRCDGDSVEGMAFGGPIFYGHAAEGFNEKPDHPGNAYWYQAKRANAVFAMLDGKQRDLALIDGEGRNERRTETVALSGKSDGLPGISAAELSADQKEEFLKVLADLLAPYRQSDAAEAMRLMEASGIDNLHLAFFKQQDVGNDGVWDVWQVEGPHAFWYFRGDPHVHAWAHVKAPA
ncbi:DUF3500 domain-containing protein [soil metagenome]